MLKRLALIDTKMRVLGSCLVILGQFFIVHTSVGLGVGTHLVADIISMPFFIRTRAWDVVVMLSVLSVISMSKFIPGL